jgi:hypothetical protein
LHHRKNLQTASTTAISGTQNAVATDAQQQQLLRIRTGGSSNNPVAITSSADLRRPSDGSAMSGSLDAGFEGHVPHMIYQRSGYRNDPVSSMSTLYPSGATASAGADGASAGPTQQRRLFAGMLGRNSPFGDLSTAQFLSSLEEPDPAAQLPAFIRPLPSRIAPEDVQYLYVKGALSLPPAPLQNALLRAYVEYVHPYMPLMELLEFLAMVDARDGLCGQVSLLQYQAVMFAATAFVDMDALREAGYATRKAARKAFFQKTRLLYDFDYESDRLILVQALLLMTYWYETPDDQKDTWHWMGVAISLAHTIGLHRNPAVMSIPPRKRKLWKRIWWSCFMRDRLVALGMRRPTRIKDEDFDVPMLEESDFEIEALPDENSIIGSECPLMRDLSMQRELAVLCIAKAKLCICISRMLTAQYSVLIRDKSKPDSTVNSTMMLFPNKRLDNTEMVNAVDTELLSWADDLPPCCQYRPLTPLDIEDGRSTVAVQRTLLHMVYYTTISALHRPQFLPSSPMTAPTVSRQAQEMSRLRVRDAAAHTTRMAGELHQLRLERYLPTTGVTVILPAMIIHLLEMKSPIPQSRERATSGFRQCMKVLEKLREIYSAADFATGFLDAALRRAAIDTGAPTLSASSMASMAAATPHQDMKPSALQFSAQTPPPDNAPYMTATESMFASASAHQRHHLHPNGMMLLPTLASPAAQFELSATSPPQTERDLDSAVGEPTPSASQSSEEAALDGLGDLLAASQGGEFDWNAVAGTDFDVEEWLQFPTEAVTGSGGSDDAFMTGVYSVDDTTPSPEQVLSWALSADAQNDGGMPMDVESRGEVTVEA